MTKKLLVPYSIDKATPSANKGFVAPAHDGENPIFIALPKLQIAQYGMVVFVGKDVTPEDLFAKVVDSGMRVLPSVEWQMEKIVELIKSVSDLKVGDVVKLSYSDDGEMILEKQKKQKNVASKLP